jgi:Nitrogenase subunit NifH (ATPase)
MQNLTVAFAAMGNKILLVGIDSKADSARILLGGLNQKTVLDTLRRKR